MDVQIYDIDTIDVSTIDKKVQFALDTNVLYWIHYSQVSSPALKVQPYQVTKYPNFVEDLLENGNELITTVLNITELANVVENSEWKIYKMLNGLSLTKKDFRKIPLARAKYKREIDTILLQLKESYADQIKVMEITLDEIESFAKDIVNNHSDIFDYVIVEKLKQLGIENFISDDKDFVTLNGINLYTAYK